MLRKPRFANILAALVMLLILLVSTGTFALAQEGGGEENVVPGSEPSAPQAPVPGGPGFLMIPVAAFTPYNQALLYANNGTLRTLAGSLSDVYTAPVFLPHGATVTKLTYYFSDTDTTLHSTVQLWRWPVPGSILYEMASVSSPVSPEASWTEAHTSLINNPLIDNQAQVYYLKLELPPYEQVGKQMYAGAVRIDYAYTTSLSAVMR
jgi:hypothetical protein